MNIIHAALSFLVLLSTGLAWADSDLLSLIQNRKARYASGECLIAIQRTRKLSYHSAELQALKQPISKANAIALSKSG